MYTLFVFEVEDGLLQLGSSLPFNVNSAFTIFISLPRPLLLVHEQMLIKITKTKINKGNFFIVTPNLIRIISLLCKSL